MAKTMARIEDSVVVNMEWCSSDEPQTETLIDVFDRPVGIGDTYDGTDFYRDGVKVLTPLETAQAEIEDMRAALAMLGVTEDVEVKTDV